MPKSRNRRNNRKKKQTKKSSVPGGFPETFGFPPDFSMEWFPPLFEGVPREVLEQAVIDRSRDARSELSATIETLERAVLGVPPLQALADFGLYGLMAKSGHDPEDRPNPILQFHVEILQAFVLRHEFRDFTTAIMQPPQFEEIHRLIRQASDNYTRRTLGDSVQARDDPQKATQIYLRDAIRIDTMSIRNWGYGPQVRRIVRDLLGPLEVSIEQVIGFRVSLLFDAFDSLFLRRAAVIHEHKLKLKPIRKAGTIAEALDAYHSINIGPRFELAHLEAAQHEQNLKLKDIQFFLMLQVTNSVSPSFYTFTVNDIVAAYPQPVGRDRLFEGLVRLSFDFGALKAMDAEHFFIGNPVWQRPLIQLSDGVFFLPVPGMTLSFPLEMVETLIKGSDDLTQKYEKRRAVFLEEEASRMLRAAFPLDQVYTRSQWRDDTSHVLYENDALVVIGRHVLVVEAKSGQMRDAARRGAPSMREDLTNLLVDAASQATRFAKFLENHPGDHAFTRRDGDINHVQIPRNAKVITLSLTLEELGSMASDWRSLQAARIAPMDISAVPSMSVSALECVFELLPTATQKLHYLQRRQEFEEHARYLGDEFDLLAFYLYTGFNIGDTEFRPDREFLHLTGLSKILDNYFLREHFGNIHVKPVRQRLSPWWRDLISYIERRRNDGWSRIGTTLLNVSYEDQITFERKFKMVQNIVKRRFQVTPGTLDRVIISNGPPQRRDAIVALAYKDLSREERQLRLIAAGADGLKTSGAQFAWVLAVDTYAPHYPYNIALVVADKETIQQLT